MSENENLRRQRRLRQLRASIVPDMDQRQSNHLDLVLFRRRVRISVRTVIIAAAVILVLLLFRSMKGTLQYRNYSVVWENAELGASDADYQTFGENILKVTMDGVSAINTQGNLLWNYGYSMRSPKASIRGDYGAVADIQSTSAVIFNKDGNIATVSTTLPILNMTISKHGVMALVLDDSGADYVTFYDSTGNALDIKIKTKLAGEGYPMDIALSPIGTGLVTSVVYMDQNSMQNQVVFYNFDVGQSDSNRMVGYYNYGDTMFPEVVYLTDTVVAAFGDDQVNLYSLKNEKKPNLIKSIEVEGDIYSVLHDEDHVGIICRTDKANRMLRVYNTDGRLQFEKEIDFDYDTADFSNGSVVLCSSEQCMIINSRGKVRYKGTLDTTIQDVICISDNVCLVMSSSSVRKIRFR